MLKVREKETEYLYAYVGTIFLRVDWLEERNLQYKRNWLLQSLQEPDVVKPEKKQVE